MADLGLSIDDAPLGRFHRRLVVYSCGGPFCDGYVLGIVSVALQSISKVMSLSPTTQGLIAAAALVGMLFGGAMFGYLTDLLGRKVMYTADLLLLVVASAAQLWASDISTLLILRLILGIAVGADYPIATALLSEFAPRRYRGMLLASMISAWWLGYTTSFVVGYLFSLSDNTSWHWILASSALPAAVVLLLRQGTPESPRWLVSKGRSEEARAIVQKYIGANCEIGEMTIRKTDYLTIFRGQHLRRLIFVCLFWTCQIIPTFAISTFAPNLLQLFGARDPILGTAILSAFFLAGVIPAILLIDRLGRRPLLIYPFVITALTFVALAVMPTAHAFATTLLFIVFAIMNAGSSVLQWVYPSELFPTEIRATALGFATAVSRIGAATGTFLFPIAMARFGVSSLMLAAAGLCAIGSVVSILYAPETGGLSLAEASSL